MSETAEVIIVGGGVMGCSTAFFLSRDPTFTGRIVVIERDPSYRTAASALSTSGVRQQFSSAVNVRLSQFTVEFLREADDVLTVDGDRPGIIFHEHGYLYLGASAALPAFERNHAVQAALGAPVKLLSPEELAARFPWLRTDDLGIASLGLSREGWIDGYVLMNAFRRAARAAGVEFLHGEVAGIEVERSRIKAVRCTNGRRIATRHVVNASGGSGARVAAMAGVELRIRNVKQLVYTFESPFAAERMPYVFSPDGLFVRSEGRDFIAGLGIAHDAPEADDFDVDYDLFEAEVWPRLAHRVPAFERLRLKGAWAGHYDMSLFDHNAFVGPVPGLEGFYLANGFSGHGMMHSPGIGRALAELIAHSRYQTLDLTDLSIERVASNMPIQESIQY